MIEFIGSALMFVVWIIVGVIALNVLFILIGIFLGLLTAFANWFCDLFKQ